MNFEIWKSGTALEQAFARRLLKYEIIIEIKIKKMGGQQNLGQD